MNLEVINYFVAAFLSLISFFIILREFLRRKNRYYHTIMIIWLLLSLYLGLGGIALLIQSIDLYKWSDLLLIPFAFLIIHVLDTVNRGSLDPFKMLIFGISITGFIYAILSTDAIQPILLLSGYQSYKNYGAYHIWTTILSLQIMLYYFFFCLMIFIKAPKHLKKKALITLLGGCCFSVFTFVIYITMLTKIIPGILMISLGISAFISSLSFVLEPKLLKVLVSSADEAKAKMVGNILPICAHCKKIKDDEGKWHQIESYFSNNSKVLFSHGLCPECVKEHYSDDRDDL